MQLEVYIHGNPKGFYYLGPSNEKDSFFQRFYNKTKSVGKELIIENAKPYCYYTFLLGKNVYDTNGRPNAYLGITVRFDVYYINAINIYTLLDSLCNKWIIGDVLKVEESNLKYVTTDISQQAFENIQSDLVAWISRSEDSDLTSTPNVSNSNGQIGQINLIDSSADNVKKVFQRFGTISISTDYALLREHDQETRLQTLNQEWTAKWNDLQGKHTAAINNAQGLNGTIQTLKGQLSQAQNDLNRVQREYEEYKSKNKLSYEVINGLREEKQALLKLASFVDSLGIEQPKIHSSQKTNKVYGNRDNGKNGQEDDDDNFKRILSYIIPSIAIVLVIWLLFSLKDCTGKGFLSFLDEDNTPVAEVIETQQPAPTSDAVITDGTTQPTAGGTARQADGYSAVSEGVAAENADTKTTDIDFSALTIDVAEFTNNVTYMKKNGAYTIRICDNKKFKPVEGVKGSWKIQDSDFCIGNSNSAETTITPKRSGNDLEIQFFVEGHGTPLKRTIVVKD